MKNCAKPVLLAGLRAFRIRMYPALSTTGRMGARMLQTYPYSHPLLLHLLLRFLERERTFVNEVLPDAETKLLRLAKAHPQGKRVPDSRLPNDLVAAMLDAITVEAHEQGISHEQACEYLVHRNLLYAQAVASWPARERRFIANHVRWYTNHEYRDDPEMWSRAIRRNARSKSAAVPISQRSASAEMQRQLRED
jgi:hypothetical protein